MLLGASTRGRDLAGSLAADLYTGLTADCTGLEIDAETGGLLQTRPAYGGNIMATILTPGTRPQMATVRPRVFEAPSPVAGRDWCQIERIPVHLVDGELASHGAFICAQPGGREPRASARHRLGGQGIGSAGGLWPLRELAQLLGGRGGRLARGGGCGLDRL